MTQNQLAELRAHKDQFFAADPDSPLTRAQERRFSGLAYFPENADLRLTVSVELFPQQDQIRMQTSTGDVQTYVRYGKFKFSVEGEEADLLIYANEHGFFLPFADALADTETYGAGRYLEPAALPSGRFLVDFNLAYNPYCAYNDRWSCPNTPRENRLKVPIRAGERLFPGGSH